MQLIATKRFKNFNHVFFFLLFFLPFYWHEEVSVISHSNDVTVCFYKVGFLESDSSTVISKYLSAQGCASLDLLICQTLSLGNSAITSLYVMCVCGCVFSTDSPIFKPVQNFILEFQVSAYLTAPVWFPINKLNIQKIIVSFHTELKNVLHLCDSILV